MTIWPARFVLLCVAGLLLQGCVAPKQTLDQDLRSVAGGRDVIVVLEQGEIRAEFAVASGGGGGGGAIGGAISALVSEGVNEHRASRAEENVRPLRDSVSSYDFDRHALEATRSALAQIAWFDLKNLSFSKDGSKDKLASTLGQSAASQLLVARYGYSISRDCQRIALMLDVSIFAKGADKPEDQIASDKALYTQRFRYVRKLPGATRRANQNAALWAAHDGEAARAAFDAGLSMVNDLLVRSLAQTAEAADALGQGEMTTIDEEHGKLVETSAKGTLLYNGRAATWTFIDRAAPPG
jgi:hypothetical protein